MKAANIISNWVASIKNIQDLIICGYFSISKLVAWPSVKDLRIADSFIEI